jgi:hypothetical protein
MLEQHNALQHTKHVQHRPLYEYFYTRTKFKLTKLHTNTQRLERCIATLLLTTICVASNLNACLILTTLNMSVLLSHLVGVVRTRDNVNSKWRPNEWATKDRSTSLDSRGLNDRIILA